MRTLLAVILLGTAGLAGAHTLGAESGIFDQLGHQLLGAHHLPLLLLVAVVCVFAVRRLARRQQD